MKASGGSKAYGQSSSRSSGRRSSQSKSTKGNDTPPLTPNIPEEVFLQLKIQQQQLAQLQQHGHLLNFPLNSNLFPKMGEGTTHRDDVLHPLEKKESRMDQLSALLEAMKQESAGTAETMQKNLREIETLHQINNDLTCELQNAKAAAEAQQEEHARQLQELVQAVEDERMQAQRKFEHTLETRQKEFEAAQASLHAEIDKLAQESLRANEKHRELKHQFESLQDQYAICQENLASAETDQEMLKKQQEEMISSTNVRVNEIEAEKQELGKILAGAFKDLEQSRAALVEVNNNASRLANSLNQNDISWQNTLKNVEQQVVEMKTQRDNIDAKLRAAEAALQMERSQKEELNAAMRTELQRYTDELQQIHNNHSHAISTVTSERDALQSQLKDTTSAVKQLEKALKKMTKEHQEAMDDAKHALRVKVGEATQLREVAEANMRDLEAVKLKCSSLGRDFDDANKMRQDYQDKFKLYQNHIAKMSQMAGIQNQTYEMGPLVEKFESIVVAALERNTLLESMQQVQEEHAEAKLNWTQETNQLRTELEKTSGDFESVKRDCEALATEITSIAAKHQQEMQEVETRGRNKLDEMETTLQSKILQLLQLQKAFDGQKARISQLEEEKRDLLQEAESLNRSLDAVYQEKNAVKAEIEGTQHLLSSLRLQYDELQDAHAQLTLSSNSELGQLRTKLKDMEALHDRDFAKWNDDAKLLMNTISTLEAKLSSQNQLLAQAEGDKENSAGRVNEFSDALERTRQQLNELQEACAEWKDKAESLATSGSSVESALKSELTSYSNQCIALTAEKGRLEMAVTSLQTQNEQLNADIQAMRLEKKAIQQSLEQREEEMLSIQADFAQNNAELERMTRSRQTLQSELGRTTDDLNDSLRQLEVLRREYRCQEKAHATMEDTLKKDMDTLRMECSETTAMNEELQAKISTIQSAANATINDLVAELTHAEEVLKAEQFRHAKDDELLRSQCRYLEEEMKRKELEWKDCANMLKREAAARKENSDNLETKFQKQKDVLESKKLEIERLTKENEQRQLKVAELERKLAPLANVKESMNQRLNEMKLALDAKVKESHDLEEKLRDEITKLQKEKRDLESNHLPANENKFLKTSLERTKQEVVNATDNIVTLTQRLDSLQKSSNATISDLSARLLSHEKQYQTALHALTRDLTLEKEKCADLMVKKAFLQKELRKFQRPPPNEDVITSRSSATQPEIPTDHYVQQPRTSRSNMDEPMAKEDLANMSVAFLRAQIGLDLYTQETSSNQIHDSRNQVPTLDLNTLNRPPLKSSPSPIDSTSRDESNASQEITIDIPTTKNKSKSKGKEPATLKLIKKKIAAKQSNDDPVKTRASDTLPKLV
ncbi:hypothetical protein Ae201684P_020562 [Aphanomyces euteiches]|nr:hypothetical protein Ae201684P_020562 [Aphanomyces euteiches]